eukprot:5954558-Pyramimonas_sp.AAC.1
MDVGTQTENCSSKESAGETQWFRFSSDGDPSTEEEGLGETSSTEYEPVRKCVHTRVVSTPHRSRARAATPHKKHKQHSDLKSP